MENACSQSEQCAHNHFQLPQPYFIIFLSRMVEKWRLPLKVPQWWQSIMSTLNSLYYSPEYILQKLALVHQCLCILELIWHCCISSGQNKPKNSRAIWAFGIKNLRSLNFLFRSSPTPPPTPLPDLGLLISVIHQVLKWANIFKGHLVLKVCGPSSNFEGNWSEGFLYFDPCASVSMLIGANLYRFGLPTIHEYWIWAGAQLHHNVWD